MNSFNPMEISHKNYIIELERLCGYKKYGKSMIDINKNDVLLIIDMQNDFVDYKNNKNDPNSEKTEEIFGGGKSFRKKRKNQTLQDYNNIENLGKGKFAVEESKNILISNFKKVIDEFKFSDSLIVLTKDYHPEKHCSFSYNLLKEPKPLYCKVDGSYPRHCVMGTKGAEIIKPIFDDIVDYDNAKIFYKGMNNIEDSYSAFEYKKYINNNKKLLFLDVFTLRM